MDILPLSTLPNNIRLKILNKLPNVPLCRIRQTCHFMDAFVEENRKKLESRETDEFQIEIDIPENDEKEDESKEFVVSITHCWGSPVKMIPLKNFNFDKQASGVTIRNLKLSFPENSEAQFLEVLPQIPECNRIFPMARSTEVLFQIFEKTKVRSHYGLRYNDEVYQMELGDKDPTDQIQQLRQDPKAGFFRIKDTDRAIDLDEGLFGKVKLFQKYHFKAGKLDISGFLQDIFAANNLGNIRKLSFEFHSEFWPNILENVNLTTLFNFTLLEDDKMKIFKKYCWKRFPITIRMTTVCRKRLILTDTFGPGNFSPNLVNIFFLKSGENMWSRIFKEMTFYVDDEKIDQLIDATDEEKQQAIMEWFPERVKYLLRDLRPTKYEIPEEDGKNEEEEEGEDEEEEELAKIV